MKSSSERSGRVMGNVENGIDDRRTDMRGMRTSDDRLSHPNHKKKTAETFSWGLARIPRSTDPQRRLDSRYDRDDDQRQWLR